MSTSDLHFLLLLLLFISSNYSLAATPSGSSLTVGASLSHNQTIQSADGMFQFGFFALPSGSSSMYLGVTYANRPPLTSVWVANRDKAVSAAAVCTFTAEGFVNLTDNGTIVWSIGRRDANASSFLLQNTGNLVLKSTALSPIWQSFENPGNTWLPGMTLGPNQKLQCWVTETNPIGGSYSFIMGKSNNFIIVYNGSTKYWDSGPWDSQAGRFSNVPEMTTTYLYNFSFNSSTGFTYSINAGDAATFNLSKAVIKSNGQIVESSYNPSLAGWSDYWSKPSNPCDVTHLCGQDSLCDNDNQIPCSCPPQGFRPVNQLEWDEQIFFHGCERKSAFNCSATQGSNDGFLSINQTSFTWPNFTTSIAKATLEQCKDLCRDNCSCNGFFFSETNGNCSLFRDSIYDGNVKMNELGSLYLRVAAVDLILDQESSSTSKASIGVTVGVAVGVAAFVLVVTWVVFLMIKRRRRLGAARKIQEGGLMAFSYAEMQAVTKNFKEKLGGGGFGTVYRGIVGGGESSVAVAVKKLHRRNEGEKEFRTEVRTIGTIQHVNLIRLIGFCSEGKHRLLVYELASHGSLAQTLFKDDVCAAAFSWPLRFNAALGAARGIAYLHESCRKRIIHCDIKPENILLDSQFNAKVADFGLAKLLGREFSHVLTTLCGTRGYLAPEWIAGLSITSKADVYSFGMTMLELLSGHRNIIDGSVATSMSCDAYFFPVWAAQLIHQPDANLMSLLDSRLQEHAEVKEVCRVAYCAIWCIQDNEDERPPMGKIVQMLEGTLPISVPPIPSGLQCLLEIDSSTHPSTRCKRHESS